MSQNHNKIRKSNNNIGKIINHPQYKELLSLKGRLKWKMMKRNA